MDRREIYNTIVTLEGPFITQLRSWCGMLNSLDKSGHPAPVNVHDQNMGEENMVNASLAGKRIAILSDNGGLAQAIGLSLSHCIKLEVVKCMSSPLTQGKEQIKNHDLDLILIAISLPTSEPVVMLNRALLTQHIGHVPLLIVSDRPFDPDKDALFYHLDFPVNADELHDKVKEILQG